MAEFSKQWAEYYDDIEHGWDFDIEVVAKDIEPGFYSHYICEGFGFIAIGKDEDSNIILAYRDWETDELDWKSLEETIKTFDNEF